MPENKIEMTIFYETVDDEIASYKTMCSKSNIKVIADHIANHGFRYIDEDGFNYQIPPNMIREIIWLNS